LTFTAEDAEEHGGIKSGSNEYPYESLSDPLRSLR